MAKTVSAVEEPQDAAAEKRGRRLGALFMALTIFGYGGLWPVMRLSVNYMPPFWFAVTRLFVGAVSMFVLLALMRRLRLPKRQDIPAILSVGLFMMAFYVCLAQVALQYVGAGRGALLAYTTALWVTPVAVLVLGERLTPFKIAGLILGLSGLAVLFNPFGFDWSRREVIIGNGLLLLAAMSWSVAILQLRVHKWNLTPLQLGPWQLLVAVVVAFPLALLFGGEFEARWGAELLLLIIYGGFIGTALAMWSTASALRYVPAMTASIGFLAVPVVSALISVAFLDEALTVTLAGGLALIISGLVCVSVASSQPGR